MIIEPVVLKGERVILEPLTLGHVGPLCGCGLDQKLWRLTANQVATEADMLTYVQTALEEKARGVSVPFVTKVTEGDRVVGSTRFGNIDSSNRKAEIGWTWIAPDWQRSFVNTEAKLLMLTHAFEIWHCVRVEFKTDALNQRSRNAILRLGATEEGTLRNHMITDSGRNRDSVFFSVIDREWEQVKAGLVRKLGSYR